MSYAVIDLAEAVFGQHSFNLLLVHCALNLYH